MMTENEFLTREKVANKFLTREEVAKKLSVSVRTVDVWRKKRGLPATKINGGSVRFISSEVDAWYIKQNENL
ncbi:MAG: helix-turn-helix domain-containing protein [Acidibacillus sp.]|nr:helix-turn-helix domain-containing protein [Acidibacillus sp.]